MRYSDLLEDLGNFTAPELEKMKSVIAGKIKQLPDDDATAKTLKEIEELLQHVNAGGRMGMIRGRLEKIQDPAVLASQKKLAQYIASMEVEPKDRDELFRLWGSDKLVNINKLLSKNPHTFSDIFNGYDSNPAIKQLVDDVMEEQALGQGKGEFGLNVLSKSVSKPGNFVQNNTDDLDNDGDREESKGDLLVKYNDKWIKVEVKTTHGGAARFSDQEVRPAEGYEAAASALNNFVLNLKNTNLFYEYFPKGLPAYGVNINVAMRLYQGMQESKYKKHAGTLLTLVENLITLIFGGKKADKNMVNKIMQNFKAGNANEVLQLYSQASFNYYMSKKDDAGVLGINLNTKSFIFYTNAKDLAKAKMRLDTTTIYLSAKDANRGAYPQLKVVPTTFGARAKAEAEAKAKAAAEKERQAYMTGKPDLPTAKNLKKLKQEVENFVTELADRRGVTDPAIISGAAEIMMNGFAKGQQGKNILSKIVKAYPQLGVPKKPKAQPAPVAPAPVATPTAQTAATAAPSAQRPIFPQPR